MVIYRRVSICKYGKSAFPMGKSTISYDFHGHGRELAKSSASDPLPGSRLHLQGLTAREHSEAVSVLMAVRSSGPGNWTDLPLMMGKSTMSMGHGLAILFIYQFGY